MIRWILCAVLLFAGQTNGYRILVISPFNEPSDWLFTQNVVQALLKRHHAVTCITPMSWPDAKNLNYTEIIMNQSVYWNEKNSKWSVFQAERRSPFLELLLYSRIGKAVASSCLNSQNVQEFLLRNDLNFDLVINHEFYTESLAMFAHKFNAPLITINSHGYFNFIDRQFGLLTPWSHVPHTLLDYSDEMTLLERLQNMVLSFVEVAIRRYIHIPRQMEIAEKHFGHLDELPTIDNLAKSVSVALINEHQFFLPARPSMPGIVFVGGAHIEEPKRLPIDIQTFLDGAEDGAIILSLEMNSQIRHQTFDIFLDAFKQVNQRVLWKWDDESIPNIPPHVMIHKSLPLSDVLAHHNVVLFIHQGGLFENLDSIYRGVPSLMIPTHSDHFKTTRRAKHFGYAEQLHYDSLHTAPLINVIRTMVVDKSYSNKAKEISAFFKDAPIHPLNETVWWIEHVAKFRGAKHLKSHAVNISWFSYLLLDVFSVIIFVSLSLLFSCYIIVKMIRKRIGSGRQKRLKLY